MHKLEPGAPAPRRPRVATTRRAALLIAPLALAAAGVTACSKTETGGTTGSSTAGSTPATGGTTGGTGGTTGGSTGSTAKTGGSTPGTTKGAEVPTLTITAQEAGEDYTFDLPDDLETGWVNVVLDNSKGALPHQVNIGRLREGITVDQAEAALTAEDPTAAAAFIDAWIGGPNEVAAESEGTGYINFDEPGTYVVLCFLQTPPDMEYHVKHGMYEIVEVTEADEPAAEPELDVAGEIEMKDFEWFLPDDFEGKGTYKLVNTADQPHEIAIYSLAEGKTKEDVLAFFSAPPAGPPPIEGAGGFGAVSKGNDAYMDLDLKPGNYVLICFLPDAPPPEHDLQPHFTHGMIKEITIE